MIKKLLALCMSSFLGCSYVNSSRFLIPEGYQGLIVIEFGLKGEPEIQVEDGYHIFRIPESGLLQTSSNFVYGTSKPFQYYYYSSTGIKDFKSLDAYSEAKEIWYHENGISECRNRIKQHTQFIAFVVSLDNTLVPQSEDVCAFIKRHDPGSFN
jgi:hypothetical protein